MDPQTITQLSHLIEFFQTLLAGGVATSVAVQILKSKYVPVQFQKFPRLTALFAAVAATVVAAYTQGLNISLITTPVEWVGTVAGVLLVAVATYHAVLKK